uniref:O-methyltransferase dimerisation domain-containing protein n=1 Tax=Salix viminalis TaxID=40686 RepID=A0A6N2L7A3_SALVM
MERTSSDSKMKQEEDVQAGVEICKYVLGFTGMAVVKCATELEIAEAIENHEGPMALSELSSTLGCVPFSLDRIMRSRVRANGTAAFEAAHGADLWKYAAANPAFNKLIDDAMACDAGLAVSAIIESSPKMLVVVMGLHWERLSGKERASEEWDCVLKEAGFSSYNIKPIRAVQSPNLQYLGGWSSGAAVEFRQGASIAG